MKNKIKHFILLFVFLLLMVIILIFFHDYLNANSNSLMVLITFVYVIATVEICRANIKSAEATRDQLAESKRQYADKKRIEIMPYIQFENARDNFEYTLNLVLDSDSKLDVNYSIKLRMKNIGNGTAKDIVYKYQYDDNCYDRGAFPVQALLSGEEHNIRIHFAYSTEKKCDKSACFIFRYKDLLENSYSQQLTMTFQWNDNGSLLLNELSTLSPVLENNETINI